MLAILAQAVLFEFAMAARDSAPATAQAAAADAPHHATSSHDHDACHPGNDEAPSVPSPHRHGGADCPFCLARCAHQAAGLPNVAELPARTAPAADAGFPPPPERAWAREAVAAFQARAPPSAPPPTGPAPRQNPAPA